MSDIERKRTRTVDDEPARDTRGKLPGRRGVGPSGSSEQDASPEMHAVETTGGAARPTGDGAWEFDDRLQAAMGLGRPTPAPAGPVRSANAASAEYAGPREGGESAVQMRATELRPGGDGAWEFDDRLRGAMGLRRSTPDARTPAGPVHSADAAAADREASESAVQMRAAEPRPSGDGAWEFDDRLRGAMGLHRPTPAARTTPDRRAGTTSPTTGGESVQLRAAADAARGGAPVGLHEAAAAGTHGTGGSLPHLDRIQASFGNHDITGISSHTGPAATAANQAMGAEAYATGTAVAFASPSPSLHTAAHEAAHIVQQRGGVQLKGGVGEADDAYERHADAVADQVVAGRSAEHLLDGPSGSGRATVGVQRKADDAAPSPAPQRRTMELYLSGNQLNLWRTVGDHARSVAFPDPHPRLTWTHEKAFVRELLMQLEANISDCVPLAKLDEILYPSNATRTIGAMLPSTDAWSPPLGLAIAQALQIAIVSSLHRLGPRYLAVADTSGAVGEGVMPPRALIYAMPIDRYVGAAMCAPHVLMIEPPSAKAAAAAKGKSTGLRSVDLTWEGERDPKLWNWVRATKPADATSEEVAAKLWTVTDHHGETNAAFNAYLLAAAPPLFGVPKRFALNHPHLKQLAPARAFAGEDSVDTELADVAGSAAADDVALHQSPGAATNGKAAAPPEASAVLSALDDCNLQLSFVATEVARWGLAGLVAPGLAFVSRKLHELPTADGKVLAEWNRVIGGQRDRLFAIAGAIHTLASTAARLGVRDPKAPEATPVREILELLATAAGTSHLAQTSDAKLQEARDLQAGLNARAVQATERDLVGAHLEFAETMGPDGAHAAAGYSHEIGELQDRSRRLQTTMINGGDVDTAEVDEVTLRSGEIALRERVLGTVHSTFALQQAAASAKAGLAAHIAMLFSGKFRNLESLCQHIRDRVTPIQDELIATEQQVHAEEQDQVGTPAQKAKHRATRRAVLARAQAAFAKISADDDLQHFFREGAKVVQDQQFRTACVQAAALIGIAVLAAATGGMAAELAGSMLMESAGVATVAELSTVARAGIATANIVADSAVNAVGQTAIQGGSLKQAFVENLFMSFASTALFGTIARASAETARLEGREAMTWAKANTFAHQAFVVGREGVTIGVHTVWGAAIGYVAHRVGGGREPGPMEAREWMLQGASVAIGRGVHAAVGARLPGLERLAKRSAEAQRLVAEARQIQQLASGVEQSKNAASAVELLDQRTKLLREEIEAIEHLMAKEGDAGGKLGKMRGELEQQVDESRSQAMLETKFHLLGLEELVPGALWKGTDKQIEHAVAEASANGGKVVAHDAQSKRWKLALDGREVEIQEAAETPRRSGEARAGTHGVSDGVPDREVPAHEQVTQKVVDSTKLTSKRVTLAAPDDRFAAAAKNVLPEAGFMDVVVHGSPDAFHVLHNGQWVELKANSMRTWLKKQGYGGEPIRLLSCEVGAHGKAIAQSIADGLGVSVKAPNDLIWVHPDGTVVIGPDEDSNTGRWVTFTPHDTKRAATTVVESIHGASSGVPTEPGADEAIAGGREDRRDRDNRLKDRERQRRKDHAADDHDGAFVPPPVEEHRTTPVGFKSEQFERFAAALHAGFRDAGIDDVVAVVQGSGATNHGHDSGRPFDEGRVSDYDVALVSPTLLKKADDLGIKLRGPLSARELLVLGIADLRLQLTKMTERSVNFQLMRSTDVPRGIVVPK